MYHEAQKMKSHKDMIKQRKASADRRPMPPTILNYEHGNIAQIGVINQH